MKKERKIGIVVAAVVLGILCVAMVAGCIVLGINGSTGKLNQKSSNAKKSDFEETEETYEIKEYDGSGEDFEIVIADTAPEEGQDIQEEGQEGSTDYLCAESDQRELTEDDVTALQNQTVEGLPEDKGIIQMVINEMYARKGYQFDDEAIQAYFDSKVWYQEITNRTDDMETVLEGMSEVEKTNIDFLSTYVQ